MQRFKLLKDSDDGMTNFMVSIYNRFMHKLSYRAGMNMAISKNKAIYGIEMYGAIHVMTSIEKRDIDKVMPKGNKMNIASTLEHQTFLIYPETARRDKLKNAKLKWHQKPFRKKYT